MKNLYFQSNDQDNGTDRLFKIRPIITAFTEKFQAVYCSEKYISVDKSMLKFHGRLRFKQYNTSKRS